MDYKAVNDWMIKTNWEVFGGIRKYTVLIVI
jgi:hypothetical protein